MKILNLNKLTIEQNMLLNEINIELKDDYHKLVNELHLKTENSIFWYVNSLLSRNNYLSKVFINLCYLELVKKISNEHFISKLIVQNEIQKKNLKKIF